MSHADILKAAFLDPADLTGGSLKVHSPIDGALIGEVATHEASDVEAMIARAKAAFGEWRLVPAPRRGELIRLFGEELRAAKDALGALVSLEAGKILQEGLGEVQEMIDICDLAVGQSRQLFGLTIASERPGHSMRETWHPLGVTGVISAFNFPVAVFSWNFALATICGNTTIWKPSEKTPLTALAVKKIFEKALARFGDAPQGMLQVAVGGAEVGEALTGSKDVPLISATGSTGMGRIVGPRVAERFGRTILELGGNNAMIVAPSADLDNAVRAIVFSAVGTCGQRCTSLRRLIVHEDVRDQLVAKLKSVYADLPIGNPLEKGTLVGPLIDNQAFEAMQHALEKAKAQGGKITGGEKVEAVAGGHYVRPAIVEMVEQTDIVKHETFAPILYVLTYKTLEEAIALQNDVPQGLSSCIFSTDVRETETFLSAAGSDCGIANVNIGPSGAEIGGAFGGEKETGGGRESGSDAWKAYMRRQTNTVNYSRELPLAQGIKFDI
ncbi:aldehyde dehydrogenase family protein [Pelagibacterium sp. H642]|uniref:L-piperidine-6-carboxylate dehydrogenase n=1 Tax=Pelagibacterium sp. H642 TaxID=1881069 RepID=UPI002815C098|nr:aldehyde dehydrogenase family protein [Pelagibacterium sp. H642]WMT89392.1 aldehyde dehydrogenase family protein [Pelagibacterium sp. H642]